MIWGSGGSKSRLATAAGAEPAGQMRDEKLHAVVARSTFASQNVQNTWVSEHFWQLRCRKSARRCGAKHILNSKSTKHTRCGPLLAVEMSKKCTQLWCEAHLEVKMLKKNSGFGPLLEVQMSKKCTPLWREAHLEVKMLKTPGVRTTFGSSDVASLHYTILHYTTLHSTTLHYATLPSTTLHYITLHSTTLQLELRLHNYTPLH